MRGAYRTIAVTNAEEAIPRSVSNQQFKSNDNASRKTPALNILGRANAIKSVFDVSKPDKKELNKRVVKAATIAAENAANKTIDEIGR